LDIYEVRGDWVGDFGEMMERNVDVIRRNIIG
jgi:hypothetical protein